MEHLDDQVLLAIHAELGRVPPEKHLIFLDAASALDARIPPSPRSHWWFD